ncbi:MAG: hypothetical protein KAT94_03405, partial [Candidatus Aenigmarchaeota archaeon]|nr:hypothetical protein [Candidatus Aenigmarchaeota archaeon]
FGSWDCHFYCIDLKGKEIWRFATSDKTICKVDPPYKVFEVVVKKEETEEEKEGNRYDLDLSGRIDESEYNVKSEYAIGSVYLEEKKYGEE